MELLHPKALSEIEQEKQAGQLPLLTLGQEVALQKIELAQKDYLIQAFGREIATLKFELIQLKGGGA
ncbi:hypothetical protein [Brevibacillus daliensis]|uniref:hypothetical protein n=1 Tax=Brevibacillus daliensis TaxID=2892995 RepID=UPI001E40617E|nr:hypothetical protein [Brevibacillus daliensis]